MASKGSLENKEEGDARTTQCKWDTMFLQTAGQTMLGLNQQSPTFLSSGNGDTEWHLRVSPVQGTGTGDSPFLTLRLVVCRYPSKSVYVSCELSIRNAVGESCFNKTVDEVFLTEGDSLMLCTTGQANDISQGNMPMMFISCHLEAKEIPESSDPDLAARRQGKDDELLSIDSTISSESRHITTSLYAPSECTVTEPLEVKSGSTILNDLEKLLERQQYGDLVLYVEDKQLVVYKGILAARSPKFAEMFASNTESRMEIKDIDFEILNEIIRYIYTDRAPKMSRIPKKLFKAADMYGLTQLKLLCEEELCANISVDNVADKVFLAVLHNGEKLKEMAIQFIKQNRKQVSRTQSWRNLIRENHQIIGEIILELFEDY